MSDYQLTKNRQSAWFAYLIEGFVGILLGLLMLFYPDLTTDIVFKYLCLFFVIRGILAFVTLLHQPRSWFWKLLLALTSLAAGSVIIEHPWFSTIPSELILLGFSLLTVLSGILGLILTLAGEGWPAFWLGILSILFGFSIIVEDRLNLVNFPYAVAILSVAGGLLAIFFSLARYFKQSPAPEVIETFSTNREDALQPLSGDTRPIQVLEITPTPTEEHLSSDDFPSTTNTSKIIDEGETITQSSLAGLEWAVDENDSPLPPGKPTEPSEWLHETATDHAERINLSEPTPEAGIETPSTTPPEAQVGANDVLPPVSELPAETPIQFEEVAIPDGKEAETLLPSNEPVQTEEEAIPSSDTAAGQEPQITPQEPQIGAVTPEAAASGTAAALETAATLETTASLGTPAETETTPDSTIDLPEIQRRLVNSRLEYIEGLGPYYAGRLRDMGIFTCYDLLQQGASRRGRIEIAQKTEVSSRLVLRWINLIDFMRIKGLVSGMVDLLEAAGIDTIAELADRNAENLYTSLLAVNHEKNLVAIAPSLDQVKNWIEQAIALPRVIHY